MTSRMTITMPDALKSLINDYNKRNPFNKLVVSQVARKAIFEFIRTNDPDLISQESHAIQCEQKKQDIPEVTEDKESGETKAQDSEETKVQDSGDSFLDTSAGASEFVQEVVQDFQDTEVLLTEGKEFTCERCRALFTSKSPNARFCSPECMQVNQGENNGE